MPLVCQQCGHVHKDIKAIGLTPEYIESVVSEITKRPIDALYSFSLFKFDRRFRGICYLFLRNYSFMSQAAIGKRYRANKTTVGSSIKYVQKHERTKIHFIDSLLKIELDKYKLKEPVSIKKAS